MAGYKGRMLGENRAVGSQVAKVVAIVGATGFLCAGLNLFAHLLFAQSNSLWVYVPPLVALAMIPVALFIRRSIARIIGWALAGLFVTSYLAGNWRWTLALWDTGWRWLPTDLLQTLLFVICLAALHRPESPRIQ